MFSIVIPDPPNQPRSQSAQEALLRVGLGDLADDATGLHVPESPAGQPGLLIVWPRPGDPPQFDGLLALLDWTPAIAWEDRPAGRYWIGFSREKPLGPEQLKRRRQEPGTWVIAGDGNRWCLPSVETLPRDYIPCNGGWGLALPERYNELVMAASEMSFRVRHEKTELPMADGLSFVLRFLRLNYRMTPEVMARLRLLNEENAAAIFLAALHPKIDGAARA